MMGVEEDGHRWGVDVDVNIGGGGGKDVLVVVSIVDGELGSVNIEELLSRCVVMKPLEKGATKTVDLNLSNRPGGKDARITAFGDGVELMSRFGGAFAGAWLRNREGGLGGSRCWNDGGLGVGVAGLGGLWFGARMSVG
jgi:hypothetical protein